MDTLGENNKKARRNYYTLEKNKNLFVDKKKTNETKNGRLGAGGERVPTRQQWHEVLAPSSTGKDLGTRKKKKIINKESKERGGPWGGSQRPYEKGASTGQRDLAQPLGDQAVSVTKRKKSSIKKKHKRRY